MRDVTPVTHTHTDRRTVESSAVFCLSRIRNILQSQLCSKVDCNTFSWTPSDDSVLEQLGVDIHVWWPLPPSSTRAALFAKFCRKAAKAVDVTMVGSPGTHLICIPMWGKGGGGGQRQFNNNGIIVIIIKNINIIIITITAIIFNFLTL